MREVEAATERINRVLAGPPLGGHRVESAIALVARLKDGVGPGPNGLAEDARITALDWTVSIEAGGDACTISKRLAYSHAARA